MTCGRNNASKLLGTQAIKDFRKGTSFNSNLSALWKEVSKDDKAAFGDWTEAEWKGYLIKLVRGPEAKEKRGPLIAKKKKIEAVRRVQPKRGVEGKTKK